MTVGKNFSTNKGGRTMKMFAFVLSMVMAIGIGTVASAYSDTATTTSGYVSDYSGNGSYYNGSYNYNYDNYNNTSYYGYYNNGSYYDYYGNSYSLSGYEPDSWFTNQYGSRFKFQWIKSPQAPAIRGDYFRAVYDMQMSYNNNSYSYTTGNPQIFADYWKYSQYNRLIAVLNGTGGGYLNNNVLDGREIEGQVYLDFDSCITRAEAAKLCIRTNDAWWGLPTVRQSLIFNDMYDHWAKNEVAQAYAVGIVNGVGSNYFNPDSTLTNQEMLTVFCNVIDRSSRYSVQNFIDMVNSGDVARITEVYWDNNDNTSTSSWRFTRDTVYMNENDSFNLRSIMSGWNNTITFTSSNTNVARVNSTGLITPVGIGTVTITARDSYGVSDTVSIVISASGSNRPVETPSPDLYFTQATITIQRGNSVDLSGYLENAFGTVTYTGGNSYVSIAGSTATGIAVGRATITANCNGQTATVVVQVVDNNVSTDLDISVEFADNNTAGNLNFIVRGIDSSCTVTVNDDSDYSLVEQYRVATWGKYAVQGLYPEGGTDTIVVCVYQNGVKVYESEPYVFYTGD